MTSQQRRRYTLIALWTVAAICVYEQARTGFHVAKTAAVVYVLGLALIVAMEKGDGDD